MSSREPELLDEAIESGLEEIVVMLTNLNTLDESIVLKNLAITVGILMDKRRNGNR